jgi:hypothetical protein
VILGGLYLGGYALNRTRLVVEVGRPHPLLILKKEEKTHTNFKTMNNYELYIKGTVFRDGFSF